MSTFKKVLIAIIALLIIVIPVLPAYKFVNPEIWRTVLIITVSGLVAVYTVVLLIIGKTLPLKTNLLSLGLLIYAVVTFGAALASPTSAKSLTTLSTYLPLSLLFLSVAVISFLPRTEVLGRRLLLISGVILALATISILVSPMGFVVSTGVGTFLFWGAILMAALAEFLATSANKKGLPKVAVGLATGVIIVAVLATTLGLLSVGPFKGRVTFSSSLSPSSSWTVAAEAIKVRPFFGAGPGNFLDIYTHARSDINNVYVSAGSELFTVLATTGLVGLLGLVAFLGLLLVETFRSQSLLERLLSLLMVVWTLVAPYNVATLMLLIPLSMILAAELQEPSFKVANSLAKLVFGLVGAVILILTLVTIRLGIANFYFLQSAQGSSLQEIYDFGRRAISLDPYNDSYRRNYALNTLYMARYIARGQSLAEDDQANIASLLQTASGESEKATAIDPNNYLNWQGRAQIAEALIGTASQASESAAVSYGQAINLDPLNPLLRFQYGNFLYDQQDYQNSLQSFAMAVRLKNDYVDAHFGAANCFKALGSAKDALAELNVVKNLLTDKSSDAYKKVEEMITTLSTPPLASPSATKK